MLLCHVVTRLILRFKASRFFFLSVNFLSRLLLPSLNEDRTCEEFPIHPLKPAFGRRVPVLNPLSYSRSAYLT